MKPRSVSRREAFTLIEFLVAAAIASLVAVVVFAIYRTASTTVESVEQDRRIFDRAVAAVETVGRDLTCAARIPLSGLIYITLDQGLQFDDLNSTLCFHTATRAETQDDTEQFQIERVSYYLRPAREGADSGQALVRQMQVLAADGSLSEPVQDEIAREVKDFRVLLFDGEKWHDSWPVSEVRRPIPSAARITLSCRRGRAEKTLESVAVIRAGMPL